MGICSGAGDTHISLQPQRRSFVGSFPRTEVRYGTSKCENEKNKRNRITPILIFCAAEQSRAGRRRVLAITIFRSAF